MSIDPLLVAALLALGACGGFLAGLLGVGGGMVLVPFVTLLLESHGFAQQAALKVAIATSLASICFTSLSSLRAHHGRGGVRWPVVAALAPGLVIGAALGASVASAMPVRLLTTAFGLFVAAMAIQMLLGSPSVQSKPLPGALRLAGMGTLIGVVASWVGAGGAFMSVPYLTARRMSVHDAIGTSSALGFPIALAGTLGYVLAAPNTTALPPGMLGLVYLPALAGLSVASVLTAPLGAHAAHRLDTQQLRRVFAVLLFGIALYMLQRAWRD